jgi:hypothetical protein
MLKFYLKNGKEVLVDMTIAELEDISKYAFQKTEPVVYCLLSKYILCTKPKRAINMGNVLYIEEASL